MPRTGTPRKALLEPREASLWATGDEAWQAGGQVPSVPVSLPGFSRLASGDTSPLQERAQADRL